MQKEYWYITDEQIRLAKDDYACPPAAIEWAQKERDWRKIPEHWLSWDVRNTKMCPEKVLTELSGNYNWYIRSSVARHPNTPVEVLIKLAKDDNWDVRCSVVINLNTPTEVLIKLAKDDNWNVRFMVTQNPNTPVEVLIEISNQTLPG